VSSGDALDEAWQAFEEGDVERALELASAADESDTSTWLLRAAARLELGESQAARAACERAERLAGADDPDVLWARAELELAHWRVDAADKRLARLLEIERAPAVLERLALVRDLQGRFDEADLLHAEAFEVDDEAHPLPARLSDEEFDAVVGEAARSLPDEFHSALEVVPVVIEPMPPVDLLVEGDPLEVPPDLLGLFVGASQLERSDEDPESQVARIYLFQRNIERTCADRDETIEQVRVTLFHELGHYLGFDEHGVEELGLG
jgi:predicted Zn-dependent protease with MMP-like domain